MKQNHNISQRFVAYILFISLFLQSCGSVSNSINSAEEIPPGTGNTQELTHQIDINHLVDKEFTSEGGNLVTFYEQDGQLQADVRVDKKQKEPNYKSLPVRIASDLDVAQLPHLNKKAQKRLIHLNIPKDKHPGNVSLFRTGLQGGMKVDSDEENDNISHECFCPITQEIMQDPVIAQDGHTYEKAAIKRWFDIGKRTSPKTGAMLLSAELTPNHTMRSLIQDLKEKIPVLSKHKTEFINMEATIKSREKEIQEKQEKILRLEQQLTDIKNVSQADSLNKPSEIIIFCGNPGVGKSSLCNSVFGKAVYKSGISLGKGMTTHKQEHIYEGKLYIDTPGLDDVDSKIRQQAALEIEKALKHNSSYKIIFVATLDRGRIRPADLVTINRICSAIETDFEYGLVFNQVTKAVIKEIEELGVNQGGLNQYLTSLHKKPSSVIVLKRVEDMEDSNNVYFRKTDEGREKLISFIGNLKSSKIEENKIKQVNITDFKKEVDVIERKLNQIINQLEKKVEMQRQKISNLQNVKGNEVCYIL